MRILIMLVLGDGKFDGGSEAAPGSQTRKAPVRQNSSNGASAARAKAHAGAKSNKPAPAARKAKNPPKRPKVYHK